MFIENSKHNKNIFAGKNTIKLQEYLFGKSTEKNMGKVHHFCMTSRTKILEGMIKFLWN
jgi:hypothetical protein